jgi:hypothetical protein
MTREYKYSGGVSIKGAGYEGWIDIRIKGDNRKTTSGAYFRLVDAIEEFKKKEVGK